MSPTTKELQGCTFESKSFIFIYTGCLWQQGLGQKRKQMAGVLTHPIISVPFTQLTGSTIKAQVNKINIP